jgi:hypothetical protein
MAPSYKINSAKTKSPRRDLRKKSPKRVSIGLSRRDLKKKSPRRVSF